jgi:hypothetical protein
MVAREQHLSNPAAPEPRVGGLPGLRAKSYQREQKFIVKPILVHYKHKI